MRASPPCFRATSREAPRRGASGTWRSGCSAVEAKGRPGLKGEKGIDLDRKHIKVCVYIYISSIYHIIIYIYITFIYIFGRYETYNMYLFIDTFSPSVLDSEVASIQDINAFQLLGGSQAEHFCFRSSFFSLGFNRIYIMG